MTTRRFDHPDHPDLDALYGDLAAADLQPLWELRDLMPAEPPLSDVPFVWRAKDLAALAERAAELVPIERGGDRRVLALSNPGLPGLPYATTTLWGAVQYLGPGESAPAHRHTPGALRFVMHGSGVWTLVDGDPVAMSAGDLVLTPSWSWHQHHNSSDHPMAWFDGLDIPVVRALDAVFFEPGPDRAVKPSLAAASDSEATWAFGPGLVPLDVPTASDRRSPLVAYRWAATDAALELLLSDGSRDHAALRFSDPTSGADVMPTLRCEMHRLRERGRIMAWRRVGSSIWIVFSGSVAVTVGERRFEGADGDIFVVPSWSVLGVEALAPTDLFCLSDEPVLAALGLSRKEKL